MRHIHFFTLKEDILPVLEAVERHEPLQYVRRGNKLSPDFETFLCGSDIPMLGVAKHESGVGCESFLVTRRAAPIEVRRLKGASGVQRYLMDQLINPDTVTLTPAGKWGDDVVLQGVVGTASDSDVSQELMKRFKSAFRKACSNIQGHYVGPQALAMLNEGKRLTAAAQCPPEFDLRLDTSK